MRKIFAVDMVKHRKCPLTRKRCLADECALWIDAGYRDIHHRYYQGVFRVGCCGLCQGR